MTETKLNVRVSIAIHMLTHLDVLFNNNEVGKQSPMHKSAKHHFSVVACWQSMYVYIRSL